MQQHIHLRSNLSLDQVGDPWPITMHTDPLFDPSMTSWQHISSSSLPDTSALQWPSRSRAYCNTAWSIFSPSMTMHLHRLSLICCMPAPVHCGCRSKIQISLSLLCCEAAICSCSICNATAMMHALHRMLASSCDIHVGPTAGFRQVGAGHWSLRPQHACCYSY